jgi:hypothetical protein
LLLLLLLLRLPIWLLLRCPQLLKVVHGLQIDSILRRASQVFNVAACSRVCHRSCCRSWRPGRQAEWQQGEARWVRLLPGACQVTKRSLPTDSIVAGLLLLLLLLPMLLLATPLLLAAAGQDVFALLLCGG